MIGKHWGKLAIGAGIALVVGLSVAAGYFVAKLDGQSASAASNVVILPAIETSPEAAQDVAAEEQGTIDPGLVPDAVLQAMPDGPSSDDAVANAPSDARGELVDHAAVSVTASDTISKPTPVLTAAAAAEAAAPAPWRDCETCPLMVSVPSGRFQMGDRSGAGQADERPVHQVEVPAFAIGRFEVTVTEWSSCVADRACAAKAGGGARNIADHPVTNISRTDALAYVRWLSKKTGRSYRLPSEAEWEYAARAGSERDYPFEGGASALCVYANGADASSNYDWRYTGCSDGVGATPASVGSFKPNGLGLHDMIGNVWEWTADCWHAGYRNAPSTAVLWGAPCDEEAFVLRGGAYSVDASKLRTSYRYYFPDQGMPFFGLRIVSAR